jgi:hypothetical protein
MKIEGAVAIVTGGARGIGLAITRTLLVNGAKVGWLSICQYVILTSFMIRFDLPEGSKR